jgi:deaminated glutathione amidase
MKAAAIQMVSGSDLAANLAQARQLLERAAHAGAELAVLPEYFCLLGKRDTDKLAIQERFGDGPIQQFLAQSAHELGLCIVGGTLPISTDDPLRVRNTSMAFSATGVCISRYDKVHLFQYDNGTERYDEARVLEAGDAPVAFDLPARDGTVWRIAMSVCYDLRFAELYRARPFATGHAATPAPDRAPDVLLVPSAFTYTTGQAHWEVLLRARAIENLAYVLAPAQGGTHDNGRRTWGHTMAIDPWGVVLDDCAEGAAVVLVDLDAQRVAQCRQQLPALAHRRW